MTNLIFKGFSDGVYILEGIYTTKKSAQDEQKRYKSIGRKAKIKTEIDRYNPSGFVHVLWIKD